MTGLTSISKSPSRRTFAKPLQEKETLPPHPPKNILSNELFLPLLVFFFLLGQVPPPRPRTVPS